jgi:hypothetical protein
MRVATTRSKASSRSVHMVNVYHLLRRAIPSFTIPRPPALDPGHYPLLYGG